MIIIKDMDKTDKKIINSSVSTKTKLKKILKLKSVNEIEDYFQQFEDVKKCGFCGNTCKIKDFEIKIENNKIIIVNIIYYKETFICYRKYNNFVCEYKKLNPNSIAYVKVAFNVDEEKALKIIHSRNSSPFYRINYNSDEEYSKAQSRGRDFFNSDEEYKKYCDKISYKNSLQRYIDNLVKLKERKNLKKYQIKKIHHHYNILKI